MWIVKPNYKEITGETFVIIILNIGLLEFVQSKFSYDYFNQIIIMIAFNVWNACTCTCIMSRFT